MEKIHFVYKTTNIKNKKFYVGVHSTFDLNDSYLGSGSYLHKSIQKYGKENFKREIIKICSDYEEAYELESLIVNADFVMNESTYNLALGGLLGSTDGWKKWNNSPARIIESNKHSIRMTGENNPMYGKVRSEHSSKMSGLGNPMYGKPNPYKGKKIKTAIISCPHCSLSGRPSNIKRYHFDKCKYKPTHIKSMHSATVQPAM